MTHYQLPAVEELAARGGPPVRIGDIVPGVLADLQSRVQHAPASRSPRTRKARPTLRYGQLPPSERPVQRLFQHGADKLTTEELLTLVVGTERDRDEVGRTGYDLLTLAGGRLSRLAGMASRMLREAHGMSPAREARLRAALELARRCAIEPSEDRPRINCPRDIFTMLPRLMSLTVSECHLLVLDTQHGVSRRILLHSDPSRCAQVDSRTLFWSAIPELPAALALVHNHPNGNPSPSRAERAHAHALSTAGRVLDIPIYDHVIVGRDDYVSFQEKQWI
jgi:DNA repair protein RadC